MFLVYFAVFGIERFAGQLDLTQHAAFESKAMRCGSPLQ